MLSNNIRCVFVAVLLAVSTNAFALKTHENYVGCLSEETLDEFITAAVEKDMRHMEALLGVVCLSIKGVDFSIIDRGWLTSKIRVYAGGSSLVLYVPAEVTASK